MTEQPQTSHFNVQSLTAQFKWGVTRLGLFLGDAVFISLAYVFSYFLRFAYEPFLRAFPADKGIPPFEMYVKAAPVVIFAWGLAIYWQSAYSRINIAAIDEFIRFARAALMGTLLAMSSMFLYRESSFSRLVFVMGGAFGLLGLYGFRQTVKTVYLLWVRSQKKPHRVLILGAGRASRNLKRMLTRQGDRAVLSVLQGDFSSVKKTIARSRISEVIVSNLKWDHKQIGELANFCENKGVVFRLIPDILELRMGEVVIDESLGIPTMRLKSISLHGMAFITKRIIDVVISSVVLGIFSVPLLIIAFLIKATSPGPVFYRQNRMGYLSRVFSIYKFRTMVSNADDLLHNLKQKSDRPGPVFKMKSDPRITIIGKILRRTSIDELPQLLNVLRGEMSVVGPRPQVLWEAAAYDDWARKRLNVLPGITGLWQVSGRAELTYEEMIDLDIFYIENWSPGLDFKILGRTLPAVFLGKGAY